MIQSVDLRPIESLLSLLQEQRKIFTVEGGTLRAAVALRGAVSAGETSRVAEVRIVRKLRPAKETQKHGGGNDTPTGETPVADDHRFSFTASNEESYIYLHR